MSEPKLQHDDFTDFRNPNDPTLDRLVRAVDRAYNQPAQVMWRGFIYGFMATIGGVVATLVVGFISVYIVSKFGLLNSLKDWISDYSKSVINTEIKTTTQNIDLGSYLNQNNGTNE